MSSLNHLFYIHSYITYIVSVSIIEELELDHSDVVFIYGRSFTHQDYDDIRTLSLSPDLMELSKVPSYGERFLLFRRRRAIQKLDRLVSDLVDGQSYIAYLPLSKNFLMSLIATHSSCRDLAFIEEGLLTYTGQFKKPLNSRYVSSIMGRIARLLKYVNHVGRSFAYRPYYHPSASIVYVVDDSIDIPNYDVRVVSKLVVPPIPNEYVLKDEILFVVDTFVEDGITSASYYRQVINSLIETCEVRNQYRIWLRSRPGYLCPQWMLELFGDRKIQVNIVPDSICIESVLHKSKNITVVGVYSSVLYYASLFGQNAYTLLSMFEELDENFAPMLRTHMTLPSIFYQRVRPIDEWMHYEKIRKATRCPIDRTSL